MSGDIAPGLEAPDGKLFGRLDGKGRVGAPSRRWQARLTDEQAGELREMREAGHTYASLAAYFGISPSACFDVVYRRTYRHVS